MSRGTLALFRDAAVFFELKGSGFLEPFTIQKMVWACSCNYFCNVQKLESPLLTCLHPCHYQEMPGIIKWRHTFSTRDFEQFCSLATCQSNACLADSIYTISGHKKRFAREGNIFTVESKSNRPPCREERRFLYFNHLSTEFLEQMIPHLKALI